MATTARKVPSSGPLNARVLIVGEAPGINEEQRGEPFIGSSGAELNKMLHEAGILRTECRVTNVCKYRPPGNDIKNFFLKHTKDSRIPGPLIAEGIEELKEEINLIRPTVIIALGETALWALTGNKGILKWRGSQLTYSSETFQCALIPTYHPAAILRQWSWRFSGVIDMKRAARELSSPTPKIPEYSFAIRPSFEKAIELLSTVSGGLKALDIETRHGHIACVGIGTSSLQAFCIPFMCIERSEGYWSDVEEAEILRRFKILFSRTDIEWTLQNGIYDLQYFARYWGFIPRVSIDTMLAHHVCFSGLPKALDFLSSIYCDYHVYWKDDGKEWEAGMGEDQLWIYNCTDCVRTYEIALALRQQIKQMGLEEQLALKMQEFPSVLRMMLKGVSCDQSLKGGLILQLEQAKLEREQWIEKAVGRPLNIRSPKQMQEFFINELGLKAIRNRKTGGVTVNDEALQKYESDLPILKPLIERFRDLRSIGVFLSTFALMPLDRDGRIRCSYNIAGTTTYRYSSSESAFGSGTNLQNIPSGDSKLPNIRRIFTPDSGYEIADFDLKGADAQIVAWEADDDDLKSMFRARADVHVENAKVIFQNERITKADTRLRFLAKTGVHATNYGSNARNLALALGITVHEAEHFQRRWFGAHPRIREWHRSVENSILTTRTVSNKFGFRRYFFDRIDGILPEALAWIPQSTIALVISRALINLSSLIPGVEPLLQVHDSLVTQYKALERKKWLPAIRQCMLVEIPYSDPLTIPLEAKVSTKSWGDCEEVDIYEL